MKIKKRNENKLEELTKKLYLEDDYFKRNPNLHIYDSPWKLRKIIPFLDNFITNIKKDEINVLDVGGGAGLILKGVSQYIEKKYSILVNKFALDLSPKILDIQRKRNPDLKKALNEDIRNTSLGDKEIDLCLMIDVLEHIHNPKLALKELKRISDFVILKVPLENNLYRRIQNILVKKELKQVYLKKSGHINSYNFYNLKHQIESFLGIINNYYFTNVYSFVVKSPYYWQNMNIRDKLVNKLSLYLFKFSPKLTSLLSYDFIMILCKCF